jgi:hypothetical protein
MKELFSKKQLQFQLIACFVLIVFLIIGFQAWENWLSLIAFVLAYCFGAFFLYIDEHFLCKFYQVNIEKVDESTLHSSSLATRNFLFILILPLLSIFVLTSSGSTIGRAFVISINFCLLVEMWQLRNEFLIFSDRFLSMSKVKATPRLVRQLCWFALVYFIFLLIILFF